MRTVEEQAKYEYYRIQAEYMQDEAFALGYAATAYVEDYLDKKFWSHIFEGRNIHFQYSTRTERGNRAKGSGQCLLYKKYSLLNQEFFICIDSDYRFLLQEQEIDIQHFVFHTYTYSIENHFCYAKRLNTITRTLGFEAFDFEDFLTKYSNIIFSLFAYSVFREKNHIENDEMNIKEFTEKITSFETENIGENGKFILSELLQKVENQLLSIFQFCTEENILATKQKLHEIGINMENAYLHIRGHDLQDRLILPILQKLKHKALLQVEPQEREKIRSQNLKKWVENIKKNSDFQYFELEKIKQDISYFFS